MKLKTSFYTMAALSAVVLAAAAAAIAYSWRDLSRAIERSEFSSALEQSNSQRRRLLVEYLWYGSERAKAQWLLRHESIGALIDRASHGNAGNETAIGTIASRHEQMRSAFRRLVEERGVARGGEVGAVRAGEAASQAATDILNVADEIVSETYRMEREARASLVASLHRAALLVIGALVTMSALIVSGVLVMTRRVLTPLLQLNAGMAKVGAGNLDYHAQHSSRADEMGELSRAFDAMTGQLRQSRAELEKSVTQVEAANKELESFAYSVSHDLRVPLRAVDGFSHMLERKFRDSLGDEGRRLIGVVRANAQKMGQLIDDILAFSRMGRKDMSSGAVDMTRLARSAAEELALGWTGRTIDLHIEEVPPVRGDAAMLHQVWVNLIGNAVKFTRSRASARIEVSGRAEGDGNVYCVRDNGVGFDMQYVHKLFGVFQRLHGVNEFEGTGIGLAIVNRVVARHGGRVWAEGIVNEGATFHFALPHENRGQVLPFASPGLDPQQKARPDPNRQQLEMRHDELA